MKLVYDEWYGYLSYAQRAAYRKYNVSPSDHDDLVCAFGEHEHAKIIAFVKRCSISGYYVPEHLYTPYQY